MVDSVSERVSLIDSTLDNEIKIVSEFVGEVDLDPLSLEVGGVEIDGDKESEELNDGDCD